MRSAYPRAHPIRSGAGAPSTRGMPSADRALHGIEELPEFPTVLPRGELGFEIIDPRLLPATALRPFPNGALAVEITLLRSNLADKYTNVASDRRVTPSRTTVLSSVYAANAGRIGEVGTAEEVVLFYAQIAAIRDVIEDWNATVDRQRVS